MSERTSRRRHRAGQRKSSGVSSPCGPDQTNDVDPETFFSASGSRERRSAKVQQVCAEVSRQAACVLAECANTEWSTAWVDSVFPDPDVSNIAIVVAVDVADEVSLAAARERLEGLLPHLRCELAAALQRQRTPRLRFVVFPTRELHS